MLYYEKPIHKGEIFDYFRQEYDGKNSMMFFLKKHQGRSTYLNYVLNYTTIDMEIDLEKCAIEFNIDRVASFIELVNFFENFTKEKRYLLGVHVDNFKVEDDGKYRLFMEKIKNLRLKNQYVFFCEERNSVNDDIIQSFRCKTFYIEYSFWQYYHIFAKIFRNNHICLTYSDNFENYLSSKFDQIKNCSFTDNKVLNEIIHECIFYRKGAMIIADFPESAVDNVTTIKLNGNEDMRTLREKIEDELYEYMYKGDEEVED